MCTEFGPDHRRGDRARRGNIENKGGSTEGCMDCNIEPRGGYSKSHRSIGEEVVETVDIMGK